MATYKEAVESIISKLNALSPSQSGYIDRGKVARLRAVWDGSTPPWDARDSEFLSFVMEARADIEDEKPLSLAAMLFGINPLMGEEGDIGVSFQKAVGVDATQGMERRFLSLMNHTSLEALHQPLAELVSYLASKGISLNWRRLMWDLREWDLDHRDVSKRWTRSYYRQKYSTAKKEKSNEQDHGE